MGSGAGASARAPAAGPYYEARPRVGAAVPRSLARAAAGVREHARRRARPRPILATAPPSPKTGA